MRALLLPIAGSLIGHVALVMLAQHAPPEAAARKPVVPLTVQAAKPKPPAPLPPPPPPPPKRVARLAPSPRPSVPTPPSDAPPPPPQGYSVNTRSTVETSGVAVPASETGGNAFADPNDGKPPGERVTVRPPPPPAPEPFQAAEWTTDERDRSPPYPGAALRNEIEGQVLLRVCIGVSGTVDSVQVVKGLGFGCDEAASDWARHRWRFRPARRGGQPVPTCLLQPMRFQLQR